MSDSKFLDIGNVFAIKTGMTISVNVPAMFVYANKREWEELVSTVVTVGRVLDNEAGKVFDTSIFVGEYVVFLTKLDSITSGHRVFAKRLNDDGSYNPEGLRVEFYQSGYLSHFGCQITMDQTPVLRTMKKVVTFI